MGKYYHSIRSGSISSALASLRMVTKRGLRFPCSNLQMALVVTPDALERSAWLITRLVLISFNVATKKCYYISRYITTLKTIY